MRGLQEDGYGSHMLPDGSMCDCGPANLFSGPQWAVTR